MSVQIDASLRSRLPADITFGCVTVRNVQVRERDEQLWAQVEDLCQRLANEYALDKLGADSHIAAVRGMQKAFGFDPSRYRPSSEALLRCVLKERGIYQINSAVDVIDIFPMPEGRGCRESPLGFPASLRLARLGFHRAGSYGLSTGIKYRESHGMYILSGIDIAIMLDPAFRAGPVTYIKRKGVEHMSTIKATLAGRVPLVNLDEGATIPRRFVFQLGHKLAPSHIRDGFAQCGMLDHILDLKTLNADRLVFTDQACREFVKEVRTSVSNPSVNPGNFETGLVSILGAFFLFRVATLGFCQFPLICGEKLGIANRFPIGEHDKRFQAQVSPNGVFCGGQQGNVIFHQDAHEVASCTILGHRHTRWRCAFWQRTRPHHRKRLFHLGKGDVPILVDKGGVGIGCRLSVAFLFEGRVRSASLKEIDERPVQVSEGLLQGDRRQAPNKERPSYPHRRIEGLDGALDNHGRAENIQVLVV